MKFNLISTVLFVVLNKEGVKNGFEQHYQQYKIDTALVYKVFCVPAYITPRFQLG